MIDKNVTQVFPRRDSSGRVASLAQLLAAALGGVVIGLVLLAVIDGVTALLGLGSFGTASGWLTAILPALLFFDDLRAWRDYPIRFVVGLVGLVVALGLGLIAAGLVRGLPAILSGTVGAAVAAVVYTVVWFTGIRWLSGTGDGDDVGTQRRSR